MNHKEVYLDVKDNGLRLLKKGQKGLVHAIFSRLGLMVILLILQLFILFGIFYRFQGLMPHAYVGTIAFTILMGFVLINSPMDATAKITWLAIMAVAPVFGGFFYWYTQKDVGHRTLKKRLQQIISETEDKIPQNKEVFIRLQEADKDAASTASYLHRIGKFPVYDDTKVTFFPTGEAKFAALLEQLETARKFIFLEYFIIDEGLMWGNVLEILARKVQEGVEVRVMYDGTNEFSTLPRDYGRRLKALGIQCKVFAPITPFISTHYNYRDHRKILVIDGHTAFTGGINLADEYINHKDRFGRWKDTAVMLEGEAAKSFTLMFLQMWSIQEKKLDFEPYLHTEIQKKEPAKGFVIPYGDVPLDDDKVGEMVYMNILNRAQRYVHIMSPYLILDGELETALKFAAERGVDVKLILPGIPDKKAAYALAKTHYRNLLASGIQIYEYKPGFVHAKIFVCDDDEAVVGTINLDYRSLYHHFECAAYMYGTECIGQIEADFQETLEACRQVSDQTIKQEKWHMKVFGFLLKVIAPLM